MTFFRSTNASWWIWEVGKTGSVQHQAYRVRAPPHAPQQSKVRSWSWVSNSYINWDAKIAINWRMVRNKHRSHKLHWIARKNCHISKVVELIFKAELHCLQRCVRKQTGRQVGRTFKLMNPKHEDRASVRNDSQSCLFLIPKKIFVYS